VHGVSQRGVLLATGVSVPCPFACRRSGVRAGIPSAQARARSRAGGCTNRALACWVTMHLV